MVVKVKIWDQLWNFQDFIIIFDIPMEIQNSGSTVIHSHHILMFLWSFIEIGLAVAEN